MEEYTLEELAALRDLARREAREQLKELNIVGDKSEKSLLKALTAQILRDKYGIQ